MIFEFDGKKPVVDEKTYISENASLVGDVTVMRGASVWFSAVVRGDNAPVAIGECSNVQDNATVHAGTGYPVVIGKKVTIGHNAIVHGCTVGDNVIVGMGAVIMNGAHVGSNSIIGAGALVREHMDIPEGSVVVGSPARVIKEVTDAQREIIEKNAQQYINLAGIYGKNYK